MKNKKNKYNPAFVNPVSKVELDQLAQAYNLTSEEKLKIKKILIDKETSFETSDLEMIKNLFDKTFRKMNNEEIKESEQFKDSKIKEVEEDKETLLNHLDQINEPKEFVNNIPNVDNLNAKNFFNLDEISSKDKIEDYQKIKQFKKIKIIVSIISLISIITLGYWLFF